MKWDGVFPAILLALVPPMPARAAPSDIASESTRASASIPTPPDEADRLHLPGYNGRQAGETTIEFEIAPEIASHNPLGSDARTTALADMALTLQSVHSVGRLFEVEFDAGPVVTWDKGGVTQTTLAGGLELRSRRSSSGFAGFGRYEIGQDFDDFLGDSTGSEQMLKAGLRYGVDVGAGAIGFELAPRWINSSHDSNDYLAGELFFDSSYPLLDKKIDLIGEVSIDRRWYLNSDPAIGRKRRDWRIECFAGLDFAPLLAPASGNSSFARSISIGLLFLNVDSNVDGIGRTSFKILPAITVGTSL